MADIGLMNAIRELQMAIARMSGAGPAAATGPGIGGHPFGGPPSFGEPPPGVPPDWLKYYDDVNEKRNKDYQRISEDHVKGMRKTNEEFFERTAKQSMQLAPLYEAIHLYGKYNLAYPASVMGGSAGRGMRAGLDISRDTGQLGFDIATAIAASFGPMGMMAGMGIQAVGRAGGASILGDLFFRREATEAGLRRTYIEDFEAKRMQNEEAAMFRVRTGRLGAQSGAWGGPNVRNLISGLVGTLNEDPQALQGMIADAFKIGGARGIRNIDQKTIETLVQQGYGTAAEVIAAQATAGRYGYGKGAAADMANRTGLTMDQVLPLMTQTRMQYFMFRPGTAESINRFVANTSIGAMNPQMGLQMTQQAAQGAAGVTDEAASMLQYREFQKANPGSTYLDFVEAKKNGFADERWRRFVGQAARTFGGSQTGRLIGAGIGLGRPGEIEGIAGTYAEGMGPDVYRTGPRITSDQEKFAKTMGRVSQEALESNIEYIGKYVEKFGEKMGVFSEEMRKIVQSTSDVVDDTIALRQRIANEAPGPANLIGSAIMGRMDKNTAESFGGPGYTP